MGSKGEGKRMRSVTRGCSLHVARHRYIQAAVPENPLNDFIRHSERIEHSREPAPESVIARPLKTAFLQCRLDQARTDVVQANGSVVAAGSKHPAGTRLWTLRTHSRRVAFILALGTRD